MMFIFQFVVVFLKGHLVPGATLSILIFKNKYYMTFVVVIVVIVVVFVVFCCFCCFLRLFLFLFLLF